MEDKKLSIVEKMQAQLVKVKGFHDNLYEDLVSLSAMIKSGTLTREEFVDLGFLCRECSKLLDESRKDCNARQEYLGKLIAMQVTQESLTNPNMDTTVRGTLARGTTDVKTKAKLPTKGTPEYQALLDHFYVPRQIIESEVLKPDWTTIGNMVTQCMEDGKSLPPGVTDTYTVFTTTFTKIKLNPQS